MKLLTCIIACVTFSQFALAQQEAQFTHYMYNASIINPAYTLDSPGDIKFGALHRSQWVGIEGSPTSTMAFGQALLKNKIQLGVSFINDQVGDFVSENNAYADLAYKLALSKHSFLSFGTKLGLRFFDADINNLNLQSGNSSGTDQAFEDNIDKQFLNVGAGLFFNTKSFYLGLSAPNLVETKYFDDSQQSIRDHEQIHGFLTGGYIFNLSNKVKLKPSFLLKGVRGAPLSVDLNTNLLFNDKLEIGLSYRLEDAVAGLIGFNFSEKLMLGYSYDYTLSKLSEFNSGSHEIMLIYRVNALRPDSREHTKSPRFF